MFFRKRASKGYKSRLTTNFLSWCCSVLFSVGDKIAFINAASFDKMSSQELIIVFERLRPIYRHAGRQQNCILNLAIFKALDFGLVVQERDNSERFWEQLFLCIVL